MINCTDRIYICSLAQESISLTASWMANPEYVSAMMHGQRIHLAYAWQYLRASLRELSA
jgi:hypothetical protein